MDGPGSGYLYGAGDRRMEIVSGKSFTANQNYCGGARPDQRVDWVSRGESSLAMPRDVKNPERRRKKRIAKYEVYMVEGRVRASLRNGFRWIKNKCSQIVLGY